MVQIKRPDMTQAVVYKAIKANKVRRPAETMQFSDGSTGHYDTSIRARHRNGMRNGAFLDGHAKYQKLSKTFDVRGDGLNQWRFDPTNKKVDFMLTLLRGLQKYGR